MVEIQPFDRKGNRQVNYQILHELSIALDGLSAAVVHMRDMLQEVQMEENEDHCP